MSGPHVNEDWPHLSFGFSVINCQLCIININVKLVSVLQFDQNSAEGSYSASSLSLKESSDAHFTQVDMIL